MLRRKVQAPLLRYSPKLQTLKQTVCRQMLLKFSQIGKWMWASVYKASHLPNSSTQHVCQSLQSVSSPQLQYTTCVPIFTKLTANRQTLVLLSITKLVQIGEKRRHSNFFPPLDEVRFQVKLMLFRNFRASSGIVCWFYASNNPPHHLVHKPE